MNNHFHLLLHCPGGGLSAFMQRVSSMYTRFRNDRIGADGPIFRGRFRSLAVDSSDYLDFAGRYIHRNPLDVRPPVALDTFRWSSYRYYVTRAEPPVWLGVDYLRDAHQGSAGYRTFVEGDRADAPAPVSWAIDTAVAEFDDADTATRQLRRAVGVAMLQRATGSTQERLEQWLAFPTDDARRMALNRSERRLANWSALAAIADRAIDLAA